jgi:hypothetical protein
MEDASPALLEALGAGLPAFEGQNDWAIEFDALSR